jgi:hypothetical protein
VKLLVRGRTALGSCTAAFVAWENHILTTFAFETLTIHIAFEH